MKGERVEWNLAVEEWINNMAKKPLELVESIPPNFYEDGISSLKSLLSFRRTLAIKHWQGETEYSAFDLIKEITQDSEKI